MTTSGTETVPAIPFTHDGYAALLDAFAARGYRAAGFRDADAARPDLILRHDLDMSIQAARPIADIEAERGWAAHYFVLLRSEMYNPWSPGARADLLAIADAGHAIGLHFDAAQYPDTPESLDAACRRECEALEQILDRAVDMVSLHRPQRSLLGLDRPIGGRPHSYQRRYFEHMGYCSDSRGGWHHGDPLGHPAVAERRALQLLTHPIWWTEGAGAIDKLNRFIADRDELLRAELAANCEPYRKARAGGSAEPPKDETRNAS